VSSELFVPSNDSGEYLFEAVTSDLQSTVKGAYASESPVSTPVVTGTVFENQAAQDEFAEATKGLGDLTVTVTTGPLAYSVTDSSGAPVNDSSGVPITGIAFTTGDEVDLFGMKMTLVTPPGAFVGNDVNVIHTEPEQKNILDIVQDYATALEVPQTDQQARDDLAAATTKVFGQWDQASERNIESVTRLGSRLAFMDKVKDNNLDFTLFAETSLSSLQDVDMSEAISKFKLEEITLEASQAVFGRISALSLFDHIS